MADNIWLLSKEKFHFDWLTKYDCYPIRSFILIGWWNKTVIQFKFHFDWLMKYDFYPIKSYNLIIRSAVIFYLDFLFLYFRGQLEKNNLSRMKNKILEIICKWLSCHIVIDCDVLQYTIKPVIRGHLWDKEKVAL